MARFKRLRLFLMLLGFLIMASVAASLGTDGWTSWSTMPGSVTLADANDETAGGLACYRIQTASATYFLEKSGAGLSSLVDRDGNDWIGFHPAVGSRAGGEFRGFPNAVHQQAGNYFHPRNQATGASSTKVESSGPDRVSISAVSDNGLWTCRFDYHPTHCSFTMTGMPPDKKYWVLYEGTPGGSYDADDWWMASGDDQPRTLDTRHEADLPAPEWIAFGDGKLKRALLLVHHEDDSHPDWHYGMDSQMTVFGFGRKGLTKYLETTPQTFSVAFVDSRAYSDLAAAAKKILEQ